jgi:hypothetical protein
MDERGLPTIGRIPIVNRYNVIVGAGYLAVTQHPITTNNVVVTAQGVSFDPEEKSR